MHGELVNHITAIRKAAENNKGRLRTIFVDSTHIEMIDAYLEQLADHDPNFSYHSIRTCNTLRLRECMNLGANFLSRKYKKFANEKGEFGLHSAYMKKVVGEDYRDTLNHLQAAGIITISEHYISPAEAAAKGIKSKCKTVKFLVPPGKWPTPVKLKETRKLREIERNPHSKTQTVGSQVLPHASIGLTRLLEVVENADIDGWDLVGLFELQNKINEKGCMTLEISRDKCGREYYEGLSNLKKELRSCILVNGQPFIEFDMPSSHSNILAFALNNYKILIAEPWFEKIIQRDRKKWIFDNHGINRDELKRFTKLVQSGKYYDHLANKTELARDEVKRALMKVFYSPYYKGDVATAFKAEFPTLYAFIQKVNGKDTKPLSYILMSVESHLMIKEIRDVLPPECSATISNHDSFLLVTEDHMELVQQTLHKAMVKYGCNPKDVPQFILKKSSSIQERTDQKQVIGEIIEHARINTEKKMNVEHLMHQIEIKYLEKYYKTIRFGRYNEKAMIRTAKQLKRIIAKEAQKGNTEPAEWVDELALHFFDNQPITIRVPLTTDNFRSIISDKVFRSGSMADWPKIISHLNKTQKYE